MESEERIKNLVRESFKNKDYVPIVLLVCVFFGTDKVKELAEMADGIHEVDEAFKEEDEGALRVGKGVAGEDGKEGVRGGDTAFQDEREPEQMGVLPLGGEQERQQHQAVRRPCMDILRGYAGDGAADTCQPEEGHEEDGEGGVTCS